MRISNRIYGRNRRTNCPDCELSNGLQSLFLRAVRLNSKRRARAVVELMTVETRTATGGRGNFVLPVPGFRGATETIPKPIVSTSANCCTDDEFLFSRFAAVLTGTFPLRNLDPRQRELRKRQAGEDAQAQGHGDKP